MSRLSRTFGFPVFSDYRFYLGDKKYRLGAGGRRALELLARIAEETPTADDRAWLVRLRDHIREIELIRPTAALSYVIDRLGDPRLLCLAVWLRGRCGGTLGTFVVARHSNSSNTQLRKEVTRCLKRLSGWAELRRISEADPNPRIRKMATPSYAKPYAARLAGFSRHLRSRRVPAFQSPLVISPDCRLTEGRPPKPRWRIRILLERIHRLMRGREG